MDVLQWLGQLGKKIMVLSGVGFGTWSAGGTYRVCWLQDSDTVPRLCAKFREQKPMFNQISSWSSMNSSMVNHASEKMLNILVVVYHFNYGWFLDLVCCLMGQHAVLKRYCSTSQFEKIFDFVFSCDRDWNPHRVFDNTAPMSCNQWLDIPVRYTA